MKRILLLLMIVFIALPLAAFDPEKPKVTVTMKDGSTKEGRLDWIDENKVTIFEREGSGLDAAELRRNNVVSISFNGDQSGKFKVGEEGVVLQNGSVLKGHISGLDATTYSFRAGGSNKVEKLERSKVAFIQFTKPQQSAPAPGPGPKPGAVKVVVSAGQPWTNAPLEVKEGDRLWFETSEDNFIDCGAQGGRSNPDGSDPLFRDDRRPMPREKACVLLGKVGSSVFRIGLNRTPFVMKASGKLILGINDYEFRDNKGDFTVIIRTTEPPDTGWKPPPSPNQTVVLVPMNQPWTATNVSVKQGQRLYFRVNPFNTVRCGQDRLVNADGVNPFRADPGRPIPDFKECALIGKVGNDVFKIGLNQTPIVAKQNGKLTLGVNDSNFVDNLGQFEVGVRVD